MYVFRIHIRPQGGTADMITTFNYCLKNNILGVGWRVDNLANTKVLEEYYSKASKVYNNLQICAYIQRLVNKGDLIWTRDPYGEYYLAQAKSKWEYFITEESQKKDIDISNVFRCDIQKVSIDEVPGKVIACFRASRSIQEISDINVFEYSKYLWNCLSKSQTYEIDKSKFKNIFSLLNDEETEDLIFLYLQKNGWFILPNSRKVDTMSFEYMGVNPHNGDICLTQVKTGNTEICSDDYAKYPYKIYLFQSNEIYSGKNYSHVICLKQRDVMKFLEQSIKWLPKYFKKKMEIINLK